MASYKVKEIFYTIQGEGAHSGRPAVFCRFSGCNLWSGREEDRHKAICQFCDTDFRGTDGINGGIFKSPLDLTLAILKLWPKTNPAVAPFVVCTGGEPLLQLDQPLVDCLHEHGIYIAVETNGTVIPPQGIDWLCVSPKAGSELLLKEGSELKLVYPQTEAPPERYAHLAFEQFYLQPMDGPSLEKNTQLTLDYCMQHPQWSFSLQSHKILNIP